MNDATKDTQVPTAVIEKKKEMNVPDLFKNVKIKKSNYLKFAKINLDKFGPENEEN